MLISVLVDPAALAAERTTQPVEVVAVAAFGARGDGIADDGPAIQKAIDAAVAKGAPAQVRFEAGGVYRLAQSKTALTILTIGNAKDLVLAGNGATLVAHPSNRFLAIFNSQNVVVRDLTLDYHPLPFTQARLTEILLPQNRIRFKVEPGYADPAPGGEEVYPDFKSSDAVFVDGASRRFTHNWGRLKSVKAHGDHAFEAMFHGGPLAQRLSRTKAGDFIAIKLHFPGPGPLRDAQGRFTTSSHANCHIGFSQGVRFERVTSHAAPVMTFVATGSEGLLLEGCRVMRKPGTDRLVAGNSDGAHFKSLTIMPQVRECLFEALMDDSINIKISSEVVKEVQGARVRLAHGDIFTDDLVIHGGQSLLFLGGGGKRQLGHAKVSGVERVRYREAWVTLERPVPGLAAGDLAFLQPTTDAVVSRCEFTSQLKTAILVYPPADISHCSFTDIAYGVHSPFKDAIEGPPPSNLRITDCTFDRPGVSAIALHLGSGASGQPGVPSMLAERCRVTLAPDRGAALTAFNRDRITLRDFTIQTRDQRPRTELIRLRNCTHVQEENVTCERP